MYMLHVETKTLAIAPLNSEETFQATLDLDELSIADNSHRETRGKNANRKLAFCSRSRISSSADSCCPTSNYTPITGFHDVTFQPHFSGDFVAESILNLHQCVSACFNTSNAKQCVAC